MKNFILLFLSVACSTMKQVTPREQTTVEIRTETVYVLDTVYIELPWIVERVQTLDTISVLENKYAKSEVLVENGTLSFSGVKARQGACNRAETDCLPRLDNRQGS